MVLVGRDLRRFLLKTEEVLGSEQVAQGLIRWELESLREQRWHNLKP